ncbi:hypothetical protein BJ085DRAFT_27252 [Dimargaris cristalligena]|uniref:Uncharacterized protein n=1 Tax=Dimargaris cristalligena TaxID=215637 RepID=A0A4P9ZU26_9FUNG|nr:hypothetical protein BJ085DRAFT_27252 [Dimargaris cristalligena]|eukprot:RKP36080.1 hypothetical protein BJ085DRAFT_27252 [Dimargaris cristalligena]
MVSLRPNPLGEPKAAATRSPSPPPPQPEPPATASTTATTATHPTFHLVVTCANQGTLVFENLAFTSTDIPLPTVLPESHLHDSVTGALVADVDYNGVAELVTVTYGQELLIHEKDQSGRFQVKWKRSFPAPLYRVYWADMNRDGIEELVVVTMCGVHILQPNFFYIREIVTARLNARLAN